MTSVRQFVGVRCQFGNEVAERVLVSSSVRLYMTNSNHEHTAATNSVTSGRSVRQLLGRRP